MEENENIEKTLKYEIWITITLILVVIVFILFASVTIYIDPFFHYHKPLREYQYPINNERYQNDGITRNFEYESIITGTSMTQNFKKSETDKIFGSNFIKVPFSGGFYKEIDSNLRRAYDSGKNIKYIIRCLDYSFLVRNKDEYKEDINYPFYLYNNNLFDDVNYVLNKTILFERTRGVIMHTKTGLETTNFDDYTNWNNDYTFGAEIVLSTYTLDESDSPV